MIHLSPKQTKRQSGQIVGEQCPRQGRVTLEAPVLWSCPSSPHPPLQLWFIRSEMRIFQGWTFWWWSCLVSPDRVFMGASVGIEEVMRHMCDLVGARHHLIQGSLECGARCQALVNFLCELPPAKKSCLEVDCKGVFEFLNLDWQSRPWERLWGTQRVQEGLLQSWAVLGSSQLPLPSLKVDLSSRESAQGFPAEPRPLLSGHRGVLGAGEDCRTCPV